MDKIYRSFQVIAVAIGVLAPCILFAGYVYYSGIGVRSCFAVGNARHHDICLYVQISHEEMISE